MGAGGGQFPAIEFLSPPPSFLSKMYTTATRPTDLPLHSAQISRKEQDGDGGFSTVEFLTSPDFFVKNVLPTKTAQTQPLWGKLHVFC